MEGNTRVHAYQVAAGTVEIEASAPGYQTYTERFTIEPEENMDIGIVLAPVGADQPGKFLTVDAGPKTAGNVGEAVSLVGRVTHDGFVEAPQVSWTVVSGPGEVTFDPADEADTAATFSEAGAYVLELRAVAGDLTVADSVEVTVVGGTQADPPSEEPGSAPADPIETNERLGLHVTQQELEVWRSRAEQGPYLAPGDVSEYSPGDWQRIRANAETFLHDPQASVWSGPGGTGCVGTDYVASYIGGAYLARDAAFVDLVLGTDRYRDAVADLLLQHASNPRLDLSDRDRWCLGVLKDTTFNIANWFSMMLVTYDYLGDESFSAEENGLLRIWFLRAAEFFRAEVDGSLDRLYASRPTGDYRLTGIASMACGRVTHYGGWKTCSLHRHYNNRRATLVRYFGLAGIKFGVESLQESAKQFFKEFITYSVYPDGMMGEYERWRSDLPDLGWAYAAKSLATLITLADHFARIGDTSLYEFQTSKGALGTEGGTKSLRLAIRTLQELATGQKDIYGTDKSDCLSARCRIDSVNEATDWYGIHDVMVAPANLYYQDAEIREVYMRDAVGAGSYPRKPASSGPNPAWTGDWGLYPGVLFMFGQMEGRTALPY